ncbi:MAG: carbohydrate ABC transporter permease [Bacteroidetes bacterium]|jgi:multiple sugar transport system permease protein|nr:carbohydrate ABC transporter permease [Anaerolineae bacterium]NUN68526.1 carbohydrate ABC transporter permease [Bacteroidota bacterium]
MATLARTQNASQVSGVAPVRERFNRAAKYILLTMFTLTWLLPLFATLLTSFRTMDDITLNGFWSIPREFVYQNFIEAWTAARVRQYLLNSFIITIPSLLGMLFLSSLSAYALARFKFKGNLLIYFMYVAGTMLPFQILLLPVFRLTNRLGLYDTYGALILIHIAFQLGFCTFVMRNFMRTVPGEILDAARVDGCGEFRIYGQIMLPLSLPSLAALATLEFTWVFNDFLWALILLQSDSLRPVTAGLATLQGQYVTDWPLITAGALLATLPTVFVFIFLQRYFIQGLTLGSGK